MMFKMPGVLKGKKNFLKKSQKSPASMTPFSCINAFLFLSIACHKSFKSASRFYLLHVVNT